MTAKTDPAQAAAIRDYRRWARECEREAKVMERQAKPSTAQRWRERADIARMAAIREAAPEQGA